MSKEDLIYMKPKGDKQSDEWRKLQKGSASDKRKFAQSLRRMKENPKKIDKDIYELITNPDASASQIQEMIKMVSQMDLKPGEFVNLIRTMIAKHSAIFGHKVTADVRVGYVFKIIHIKENGSGNTGN